MLSPAERPMRASTLLRRARYGLNRRAMRAVSVVLFTAHQDTGLVDYFNYRVAATAASSPVVAATSATGAGGHGPSDQGRRALLRRRKTSPLVRFPQMRIEHHCPERLREES